MIATINSMSVCYSHAGSENREVAPSTPVPFPVDLLSLSDELVDWLASVLAVGLRAVHGGRQGRLGTGTANHSAHADVPMTVRSAE